MTIAETMGNLRANVSQEAGTHQASTDSKPARIITGIAPEIPYYSPDASDLFASPEDIHNKPPNFMYIQPMGIIIHPNGILPGIPMEAPADGKLTNGWDMEKQIGWLYLEGLKDLWNLGYFSNKTHVGIPSGVDHEDENQAGRTDWAGPMKAYVKRLQIPHLTVIDYFDSIDSASEMFGLAKIIARNQKYHSIVNLNGMTMQGERSNAFWALALAYGEPGPWASHQIGEIIRLIAGDESWQLYANPQHMQKLMEYVVDQEPDQDKLFKKIKSLQYVHELSKYPDIYFGDLTVEQLVINASRSLEGLKRKRGMDLRKVASKHVLTELERRKPVVQLLGWEHIFGYYTGQTNYRNNLLRRPDIQITDISQKSGLADALHGMYYHNQRMTLREQLIDTGKTPTLL